MVHSFLCRFCVKFWRSWKRRLQYLFNELSAFSPNSQADGNELGVLCWSWIGTNRRKALGQQNTRSQNIHFFFAAGISSSEILPLRSSQAAVTWSLWQSCDRLSLREINCPDISMRIKWPRHASYPIVNWERG